MLHTLKLGQPSCITRATPLWLVLLWGIVLTFPTLAEEEGEADARVQYIAMKPSFVLNYGEPAKNLRYAKVDISLRVNSNSAAETVETHMPALRNEIVLLLSRQPKAQMSAISGRETLRKDALDRLNATLKEEAGTEAVADLLFTNFVIQG